MVMMMPSNTALSVTLTRCALMPFIIMLPFMPQHQSLMHDAI
jgi:hypothetical protein